MESLFRVCLIFSIGLLFFWGCASKEYFKPIHIEGKKTFSGKLSAEIIETSQYGATLKNRDVLTENNLNFSLQKDENFIGYSQGRYIVSKSCNTLILYDKDKKIEATFEVSSCPMGATIEGNQIAIVGNDNSFSLYEISTQKEIFSKKSNAAMTVNSKIQAPVFFEKYIFYPTLDGGILMVNHQTLEIEKTIVIDSSPYFNNIIFLDTKKDFLIASTSKRILSLYRNNTYTYDEEIRGIKVYQDRIYITTLDGQVKELDLMLNPLRTLKFQFASLPLLNIFNDHIYMIEDGSGFLIEVDLKTFTPKIYELSLSREKNIFSWENKLYYDDRFLDL